MVVKMANKEEKKENILYETIANEIDYGSLPRAWQLNKIEYFSNRKTLFD